MQTTVGNIEKLARTVLSFASFKTTIYCHHDECIREAQITCDSERANISCSLFESPGCLVSSRHKCSTLLHAFEKLLCLLPGATIFPHTLRVEANGASADALTCELVAQAWSDMFDHAVESSASASREEVLKNNLWGKLVGGPKGVQKWNASPSAGAQLVDWNGSQLSKSQLEGVVLNDLKFHNADFSFANLKQSVLFRSQLSGTTFTGANLLKAKLEEAILNGADFSDCNLKQSKLKRAHMRGAGFRGADLRRGDLSWSDLRGADLSSAVTTDANFDQASYDETTKLPPHFAQWSRLRWMGSGPDPYQEALKVAFHGAGISSFEDFVALIKGRFETKCMNDAIKMLKKDRYQLFSHIEKTYLLGVIKSEKDPDVVYGCMLAESGEFVCGFEDLSLCDGSKHNEICKHILVLALGLARAKKLDLGTTARWIFAGKNPRKRGGKDPLAEVFLNYTLSDRSEIDWRPTETMPEDYYAF